MNNKIEIEYYKSFTDIKALTLIIYYICITFVLFILLLIRKITMITLGISTTLILIIPILKFILKLIFNKMQIIYNEREIIKINNAPNRLNCVFEIFLNDNNNIKTILINPDNMSKEDYMLENGIYILLDYEFEPHKYIFTKISKISKQPTIQQEICYIPHKLKIQMYRNQHLIHETNLLDYSHLINKHEIYAESIESIIQPAINDSLITINSLK